MRYNLIKQLFYLAVVSTGNLSQYDFHKRKLSKRVRKYADTIKTMNGSVRDCDDNSPWNRYNSELDDYSIFDFDLDDDDDLSSIDDNCDWFGFLELESD